MEKVYEITFINSKSEIDYTQLNADSEEEVLDLFETMKEEFDFVAVLDVDEVGCVRYYISAIGYDEDECVTDFEDNLGDYDTEEEARAAFEEIIKTTDFKKLGDIEMLKYWKIQIEQCEETDGIHCIDTLEEFDVYPITLLRLTNEEANLIDRATKATKTDCWFFLVESEPELYYVRDLEQDCNLQLDEALGQVLEAFEDLEALGFTKDEISALDRILVRLGIINE